MSKVTNTDKPYCFAHSKPISECGCCPHCFEKLQNCICVFVKCAIGSEQIPESEAYEYRGAIACEKHFDEMTEKRDKQRQHVMEVTEKSAKSQANGEWQRGGYKTMKTDEAGRPITKVREPQILKDYEDTQP